MPRPDRSFRTPALILKRRDFGEADRLLTILTPHYGKIDVIARGARKLNSTKTGHVELYTRAEMLIHTGRDLAMAAQAEMSAANLALREDLTRGAYAGYAAELLDRLTAQDELLLDESSDETDAEALFNLLDHTFRRISDHPDPRLAVRSFEMRLLDRVGYRPELTRCVGGREAVIAQDQYFSARDGGVLCPEHAQGNASAVPIPLPTLKLLRHIQRSGWRDLDGLQVAPNLHDDAERIMVGYVTYILERRLQSIDFIRHLRRTPSMPSLPTS